MKHKQIIWDFNGTLLDDVRETLDATNALLARYGKPMLADADAYRRVFGFPVIDYTRRSDWNVKNLKFTPTNGLRNTTAARRRQGCTPAAAKRLRISGMPGADSICCPLPNAKCWQGSLHRSTSRPFLTTSSDRMTRGRTASLQRQ